jgi:hypothetical protein
VELLKRIVLCLRPGFQCALHASAVSHTDLPVWFYRRARDAIRPHSPVTQLRAYTYKLRLQLNDVSSHLSRRMDAAIGECSYRTGCECQIQRYLVS